MASPRTMNPDQLQDLQVIDSSGTKVGKVSTIYLDNDNGLPEWAAVKSGMFGSHETLVPLAEAQAESDALKVPLIAPPSTLSIWVSVTRQLTPGLLLDH